MLPSSQQGLTVTPKKMPNDAEVAISFRNAYKQYGRSSKKVPVLMGLDMTIPKGAIYGLLGPSGCGKTTLLQCIVGKKSLKSGDVTVFGGTPGSAEAGVPGTRVGYMPQELALYGEFTITETLQYFGRIFNLKKDKVKERTEFLLDFLDLPKEKRLIANLSGGQQRRASLAAALLHEPELLILDEPTVGVDPLLRQCIWTHLLNISRHSHLQTTIVITTHYIEEARQANVVGMMRFGRLLAEGHPDTLLEMYGRPTLEDVFLHLCLGDESEREEEKRQKVVEQLQIEHQQDLQQNQQNNHLSNGNGPIAIVEANGNQCNGKKKKFGGSGDKIEMSTVSSPPVVTVNGGGGGVTVTVNGAAANVVDYVPMGDHHNNGGGIIIAPGDSTLKSSSTSNILQVDDESSSSADSDSRHRYSSSSRSSSSRSSSSRCSFLSCHRMTALLIKNFIRMWRNIPFLIFQFIIPTIQVSLFCLAIGRDPRGVTMAVFNEDINTTQCEHYTTGCILGESPDNITHKQNLSCRFLSYVDKELLAPVYFDNLEDAVQSVKRGKHWGVMHFKKNFTNSLYDRLFGLVELRMPDNDTLERSDIHVNLDMTNQQIGYTIQLRLSEAYLKFSETLLESCLFPPKLAALPIVFEKPIYGNNEPTFTEFMAPGVIISIIYFMAVGLTAVSFIIERKEGLLDRSWVAGVTATEVMLAHVIAQFAVMVVQVALVLIFMIYVFKVPAVGSIVWIVLLTMLQGICGMAFGLVISAIGHNEQDAIQLALGSFYPNLLLSGIIWPLEGMPEVLRYISYILPQTYACEAMRGILSRGWGLEWVQVYRGYLVTIAWTVGMLILSAVLLKIRR